MKTVKESYRHIFLVQNRDYWKACPFPYDKERDLVLSFDFAVVREVFAFGGEAGYLDHLVASEDMERYNHETYGFFYGWHRDADNRDIFTYKGLSLGNAFRLEIWNDVTYFARMFFNITAVKSMSPARLFVGLEDQCALSILGMLDLKTETWAFGGKGEFREYYFPVFSWMHERINPTGTGRLLKVLGWRLFDTVFRLYDRLFRASRKRKCVFVQRYYPTKGIIEKLKTDNRVQVILETYTPDNSVVRERRMPVQKLFTPERYEAEARRILGEFEHRKSAEWLIEGVDIGRELYAVIMKKISGLLPAYLQTADTIIRFFSRKRPGLMITTTNIGVVNCLALNYCHANNIPTYLIINGLLWGDYYEEGKDATWINSYGESIKNNYFKGMENVVCLGDPRMDAYAVSVVKEINYDCPTIVIGAGGFSNMDLNSYTAFEFDFLNDVMNACRNLIRKGRPLAVWIKVRSNGYLGQYEDFLKEYSPDVPVKLFAGTPMKDVLAGADFYLSIYSQTLFEASCLGIPVLYYKKDTEKTAAPFDGRSELVTALSPEDLELKMEAFYAKSDIYAPFMDRKVMEKYIGPLDGNNLKRNLDFIYSLLGPELREGTNQ